MTGLVQSFSDLKLIVQTDRRVWAAGGFLCCVVFIWVVTGAWREEDPPVPEKYIRVKVEEDKINDLIKEFNKDMREGEEERKFLKDYIARVSQEVNVGKEEIDWHVNVLVNKLDDMTERVDLLANKVGASSIKNAQFEERLKQQKKNRKRKKAVDRSDI